MWTLGSSSDMVVTPSSSFAYLAAARTSALPLVVSRTGQCVRPLSPLPFAHGWLLVKTTTCYHHSMLLPEMDMLCQDCPLHDCPCGALACASHSAASPPLFPRPVGDVAY